MSLYIYSLAHKRRVAVSALIDPAKVGYGEVNPVTLQYKVGSGAPAAYKNHAGLDSCGPHGCEIYSVTDGVVRVNAYESGGAGNYVSIGKTINGKLHVFLYMHMKERSKLKKGQAVKAGDLIGYQGSTGNSTGSHLHFGVKVEGKYADPYDWLTKGEKGAYDMNYATGTYKITATVLNVRDKPGTEGRKVAALKQGDTPAIIGLRISDDNGAWGYLGADRWICIETPTGEKYAERIGELPDQSEKIAKLEQQITGAKKLVDEAADILGQEAK